MKLTFLSAADSTTASRRPLDTGNQRLLLDCGMFQGYKALRERNWAGLGAAPVSIDAVMLSHADGPMASTRGFKNAPSQVYVVHGERAASDALRSPIQDELGWSVRVPRHGTTVAL